MRYFNGHKYTYTKTFGTPRHSWEFRSAFGGIHFHVNEYKQNEAIGLEYHSVTGKGAPDHIDCPITGGRCWHDGTSLYAEERLWQTVKEYLRSGDHDAVFSLLESVHDLRWREVEE
jgi:hypothetical protein